HARLSARTPARRPATPGRRRAGACAEPALPPLLRAEPGATGRAHAPGQLPRRPLSPGRPGLATGTPGRQPAAVAWLLRPHGAVRQPGGLGAEPELRGARLRPAGSRVVQRQAR